MEGEDIQLAKEALTFFLQSLNLTGTYFNVCSFGTDHKFVFPDDVTVQYTQENFEIAG